MSEEIRIALDWWPPEPDGPMGTEKARELVAALKPIIGPVVDAAEADLRQRIGPEAHSNRRPVPVRYLATTTLGAEMQSICLGTVSSLYGGDVRQNSIQLMRDGTVTWRRSGWS